MMKIILNKIILISAMFIFILVALSQAKAQTNDSYLSEYHNRYSAYLNESNDWSEEYKILVDKKMRELFLLNWKEDRWDIVKRYPIGLSKTAGILKETRKINSNYAYLIVDVTGHYSSVVDGQFNPTNNAIKGNNIVTVDVNKREIFLYQFTSGKWSKTEKLYRPKDKIVLGNNIVWFLNGRFIILQNKDLEPKKKRNDYRTPEGRYYVANINPASSWGLDTSTFGKIPSLLLSYPGLDNAAQAVEEGVIDHNSYEAVAQSVSNSGVPPQGTQLGGYIMIHGGGAYDWTAGCIALDNGDLKELLMYVKPHTPVEII